MTLKYLRTIGNTDCYEGVDENWLQIHVRRRGDGSYGISISQRLGCLWDHLADIDHLSAQPPRDNLPTSTVARLVNAWRAGDITSKARFVCLCCHQDIEQGFCPGYPNAWTFFDDDPLCRTTGPDGEFGRAAHIPEQITETVPIFSTPVVTPEEDASRTTREWGL